MQVVALIVVVAAWIQAACPIKGLSWQGRLARSIATACRPSLLGKPLAEGLGAGRPRGLRMGRLLPQCEQSRVVCCHSANMGVATVRCL
eukprot:15443678-Alexandrium_andersonii.AAC.1